MEYCSRTAVLLHGFVLLSPMPFLQTLPAIAVMILGVGLLNHDGLLLATGLMLSVGVLTIVVSSAGVLYTMFHQFWGWVLAL